IETDVEPFALAAAERLFDRAPDDAVAALVQAELDELAFETSGQVAPGKVGSSDRGGELQIFANREVLIEGVFLGDVTDIALEQIEILVKRPVVQEHLSLARLELSAQDLHERALA